PARLPTRPAQPPHRRAELRIARDDSPVGRHEAVGEEVARPDEPPGIGACESIRAERDRRLVEAAENRRVRACAGVVDAPHAAVEELVLVDHEAIAPPAPERRDRRSIRYGLVDPVPWDPPDPLEDGARRGALEP